MLCFPSQNDPNLLVFTNNLQYLLKRIPKYPLLSTGNPHTTHSHRENYTRKRERDRLKNIAYHYTFHFFFLIKVMNLLFQFTIRTNKQSTETKKKKKEKEEWIDWVRQWNGPHDLRLCTEIKTITKYQRIQHE